MKEQEIAQLKVSHSELTQMALEGVPTQSKVKEEPGLDTDSVINVNSAGGYQQCLKSPARENFETESARPRRIFRSSRPGPEPRFQTLVIRGRD